MINKILFLFLQIKLLILNFSQAVFAVNCQGSQTMSRFFIECLSIFAILAICVNERQKQDKIRNNKKQLRKWKNILLKD
jgi:hypothetical protein